MSEFAFEPVQPPEVDRELITPDEIIPPGELASPGPDAAPEASELQVRACLAAVGGLAGFLFGNREISGHWRPLDDELDDLTPPVTRMVNASPRLQQLVVRADAFTAGMVLMRYTLRNLDLQRRWNDEHPDDAADAGGGSDAAGAHPADAGHSGGPGDAGRHGLDARTGAR